MSVPTEPGFYYVKWPVGTVWTICEVDSEMNVWVLGSDHARYERDMEGWVWGPRIPEYDPNAIPIEKFAVFARTVINDSWEAKILGPDNLLEKAMDIGLVFNSNYGEEYSPGWPKLEGDK